MAKADETPIRLRIVIDGPVPGVMHSLQAGDSVPLDPKSSGTGEPLSFDFMIHVAPGPRFLGDQVRREGPLRRFVYIRAGDLAGDAASPWSRRMKIDIHDIAPDFIAGAIEGQTIETVVHGTLKDGSPSCGTVRPTARRLVPG